MSHHHSLEAYRHSHDFLGAGHQQNARRTWGVVALTTAMMGAEIVAGWWTGSMALLADGLHMATHAGALTVAGLAYLYAQRHRHDRRFSFGTGKVGDLAGFSSALVLAVIALGIGVESLIRLMQPVAIAYDEAIWIACVGLAVNLLSAWMLHGDGHHDHHHHHHDDHHHHAQHAHGSAKAVDHHVAHHTHAHATADDANSNAHADHNLRSAYLHVIADAVTSVLAIVALVMAKWFGWIWMDAAMGVVGAVVIARWSLALLRDTGMVLLDASASPALCADITARIEQEGDRITDLHVWRVGPGHHAAILSLVTDTPRAPATYHAKVADLTTLRHLSVEVHPCRH
ncbi:CDF family Co(II)/Ni(II) efflux transporter DmeF [Xanthomonas maliensis]|uniref:CDF family Co(II)/Ni(II) efflux transporter DmeF n=1 Tax=Xanthomonas maliensis TaxID=1321368 RepID=UPI0003A15B4F|nr:CDF family Co(II)/Ni(II) efflux transporter DmeF [Xanthomonas maliensis]KAB7771931.1 cation transporter [Xanthomonas maliensis]